MDFLAARREVFPVKIYIVTNHGEFKTITTKTQTPYHTCSN